MTGGRMLAPAGLAAGVGILGVVVALFQRVVEPALEIRRYGQGIDTAIAQIARNLEPLDALTRTHELGAAVPGLAQAYLERLGEQGS